MKQRDDYILDNYKVSNVYSYAPKVVLKSEMILYKFRICMHVPHRVCVDDEHKQAVT